MGKIKYKHQNQKVTLINFQESRESREKQSESIGVNVSEKSKIEKQ